MMRRRGDRRAHLPDHIAAYATPRKATVSIPAHATCRLAIGARGLMATWRAWTADIGGNGELSVARQQSRHPFERQGSGSADLATCFGEDHTIHPHPLYARA